MTGYTVHTGSTKKFTTGWDRVFQGAKPKTVKQAAAKGAQVVRKQPAKQRGK
jgi:hypothetical protein